MLTETEFTYDHLEKLLDMCKKYFPEYDDTMFYQLPANDKEIMRFGKIWFYTRDKQFEAGIHWYELCLTFLFDRMFDPENQNLYAHQWHRLTRALLHEGHPIDFLYDLYKTA